MNQTGHARRILLKTALSALCSSCPQVLAGNADLETGNSVLPANPAGKLFISGARQSSEQHVAVVFDERGQIITSVPLSARAHGAAAHVKTYRGCLFARRPGTYLNAFDIRTPRIHQTIRPQPNRHYYGHGVFSTSGHLLFATENDFDGVRGIVGIYDAEKGYQRIGEMISSGIGPHEIVRLPGSHLLVVANGGIQTHPDSGRDKLNVASMLPSVSIIDSRNGQVVGQHYLDDELHQVSIRHLACTEDGEVWFAAQYEGGKQTVKGLAGVINVEQSINSFQHKTSSIGLSLIDIPANLQKKTLNYLSSVAVAGSYVIYTAAKGGLTFTVNRQTKQVEDSVSIFDCSGVASLTHFDFSQPASTSDSDAALVTTGTGEIVRLDENGISSLGMHSLQWDNHVYRLS